MSKSAYDCDLIKLDDSSIGNLAPLNAVKVRAGSLKNKLPLFNLVPSYLPEVHALE